MNILLTRLQKDFSNDNDKDVLLTILLLEEGKSFKNISLKRYSLGASVEKAQKRTFKNFLRHCLNPVDYRHLVPETSIKDILDCVDHDETEYIRGFVKDITQGFPTYKGIPEHERICFSFFSKLYKILLFSLYPENVHEVNGKTLVDLNIVFPNLSSSKTMPPAYGKKRGDIYVLKSYDTHVTSVIDNLDDENIVKELYLHPDIIIDHLRLRSSSKEEPDIKNSYVITHLKRSSSQEAYISDATKQLISRIDCI